MAKKIDVELISLRIIADLINSGLLKIDDDEVERAVKVVKSRILTECAKSYRRLK